LFSHIIGTKKYASLKASFMDGIFKTERPLLIDIETHDQS